MGTALSPSTRVVGLWAATAAAICSVAYVLGQLAEWLGWLGSAGGPSSMSTPFGSVVLLTPSLVLGPSFLLLMAAVHDAAPRDRKVWSLAAVLFATIYCTLIAITYYVQLAWVLPRMVGGRTAGTEPFLFVPFDSFLYAVDILGYSFMSAATLCAAPVFGWRGLNGVARGFLVANGLVLPFLAFQMYWHDLIWIAAAWAITFPGAMITLARLFSRAEIRVVAPVVSGPTPRAA